MKADRKEKKKKISTELKELALARLEITPQNFKLSVGNKGTFTKDELIEHVKRGDTIGVQIVEMQLKFIKALTSGKLMNILAEQNE